MMMKPNKDDLLLAMSAIALCTYLGGNGKLLMEKGTFAEGVALGTLDTFRSMQDGANELEQFFIKDSDACKAATTAGIVLANWMITYVKHNDLKPTIAQCAATLLVEGLKRTAAEKPDEVLASMISEDVIDIASAKAKKEANNDKA